MSRSGGNYTAPSSSWNPAVEGTTVDETDWNALLDDIEAALTESVYTGGLGSSDNRLVRTDGVDSKKVQGSGITVDDSDNITTTGSVTVGNTGLVVGASTPFSDASGTLTLQNVDALDATTEATIEAAIDTLANLTTVQGLTVTLADAGADAFWGWDDSAGAYENLTSAEATAILDAVIGDSGAGGAKGLVPAPAAGDAAANKFLKADGTWVAPAGTGDMVAANNLSDVASASTSRSNLGITAAGDNMVTAANAAAQTALLDAVIGDSGAGGTKGLVPAPAAGDAAANKFLKADGTWVAPAGTGDMVAATYDPAAIAEQLVGLAATQTLTNKTLTTPTLTLKQSASPAPTAEGDIQWNTDGDFIVVGDGASQKLFYPAIDEDTMLSDSATRVPTQQSVKAYVDANSGGGGGNASYIDNLTITTTGDSPSAGDLTIGIKTLAGSDPSAGDPIAIRFRSATAGSGNYVERSLTSALSLTITSGSTMGFTSATAGKLWLVIFDDGGTLRLGAVNCLSNRDIFFLGRLPFASSTAEGGAGGADSAHVIYTGTGVTSKPYVVIGNLTWSSGLSTAGDWDVAEPPSVIQLYGPGVKLPGDVIQEKYMDTSTTTATTSTSYVASDITDAITPTNAANIIVAHGIAPGSINSTSSGGFCAIGRTSSSNLFGSIASWFTGVSGNSAVPGAYYGRDFPGTTATTTYTIYIKVGGGSSTFTMPGNANYKATMSLQELQA